jgi:cyclophilin family peptidyl-prolyl cis-trans isomerase
VEIQLKTGEDSPSSVILELDSKQMPHASYHFLQMVELHLWEGLPLARGMDDRFVASPSVVDEQHHSGLSRFTIANLTHLAFQEYTKPILQKYSVAFAGSRPAGPVFVIRMLESKGEDDKHEATFATVVKGHDVLDKLMSRPLETGSIKMEHVRVVNQPTSPVTQPGVQSSRL